MLRGMTSKLKFLLYSLVALIGGLVVLCKLGVTTVYVPGFSNVHIGFFIVILILVSSCCDCQCR